MATLAEIRTVVGKELDEFEVFFRQSMKSTVPLLDKITYYLIKRRGKQLRPMLVFLSAGIYGNINPSTFRAASLIELLHTATLVHDDVVDDTYRRRGFFSINALWKNKIAVLVGDYLLSRGLLLAIGNKDFTLLERVSTAVRKMSEGELLQIEKARTLKIKEEEYMEIIRGKTASLVAACCSCGAISAGFSGAEAQLMWDIGEMIGMAFQIKDDLLDYTAGKDTGKTTGTDIKEKNISLPLLHALRQAGIMERIKMINLIKNHSEESATREKVFNFVFKYEGINYAETKMAEYRDKARALLQSLPSSPYKTAFEELITFVTERKN